MRCCGDGGKFLLVMRMGGTRLDVDDDEDEVVVFVSLDDGFPFFLKRSTPKNSSVCSCFTTFGDGVRGGLDGSSSANGSGANETVLFFSAGDEVLLRRGVSARNSFARGTESSELMAANKTSSCSCTREVNLESSAFTTDPLVLLPFTNLASYHKSVFLPQQICCHKIHFP